MRPRFLWALVPILFHSFGAVRAQESAPPDPARIDALLESMRAGAWSLETYVELMDRLAAEKAADAMDWWTTAAEDAASRKLLPPAAKETIRAQRKRIAELGRAEKEARIIWTQTADLVRALLGRKVPRPAARALEVADRLSRLHPHEGWHREVENLRKRLAKVASSGTPMTEAETALLADLEKRLAVELDRTNTMQVEQFRRFGHPDAYRRLKQLLMLRREDASSRTDQVTLNAKARKLGMCRNLVLVVLGNVDFVLRQDGEVVKCGESDSFSGETFSPIEIPVLPGETLGFAPRKTAAAKEPAERSRWFELYLHASVDGVDLPIGCFGAQVADSRGTTASRTLLVGAKTEDTSFLVDGKPLVVMDYHDPAKGPGGNREIVIDAGAGEEEMARVIAESLFDPHLVAYSKFHQDFEALPGNFPGQFTWTLVVNDQPLYTLRIPDPESDPKPAPKK